MSAHANQYRTVLTDPYGTKDRPQQALHPDSHIAHEWAAKALEKASKDAYVTLYLTTEVEIHVWKQEPRK